MNLRKFANIQNEKKPFLSMGKRILEICNVIYYKLSLILQIKLIFL